VFPNLDAVQTDLGWELYRKKRVQQAANKKQATS